MPSAQNSTALVLDRPAKGLFEYLKKSFDFNRNPAARSMSAAKDLEDNYYIPEAFLCALNAAKISSMDSLLQLDALDRCEQLSHKFAQMIYLVAPYPEPAIGKLHLFEDCWKLGLDNAERLAAFTTLEPLVRELIEFDNLPEHGISELNDMPRLAPVSSVKQEKTI